MVMKRRRICILVALLALATSPCLAVLGCLGELDDLTGRSTAIVYGEIVNVTSVQTSPCPPRPKIPCGKEFEEYLAQRGIDATTGCLWDAPLVEAPLCGPAWRLTVQVTDHLLGDTPASIEVYVHQFVIELDCDDQPRVNAMNGLLALLFLDRHEGRLWIVDGKAGLFTYSPQREPGNYPQDVYRVRALGNKPLAP